MHICLSILSLLNMYLRLLHSHSLLFILHTLHIIQIPLSQTAPNIHSYTSRQSPFGPSAQVTQHNLPLSRRPEILFQHLLKLLRPESIQQIRKRVNPRLRRMTPGFPSEQSQILSLRLVWRLKSINQQSPRTLFSFIRRGARVFLEIEGVARVTRQLRPLEHLWRQNLLCRWSLPWVCG